MNGHPIEPLVAMFGIVGSVVLVAALLSGFFERTRLPQVLVFLGLGTALGPYGLDLVSLGVDSFTIRVVATLGLLLVLFTDAVDVAFTDLWRQARLAALILGPGTLLVAATIAFAARGLLGFGVAESAILGAALASTDPVLLRPVLRSPAVPGPARHALRVESGMNDAVLLPVVLVALSVLAPGGAEASGAQMARAVIGLFVPGIGGGLVVGLAALGALHVIRRRFGIRRDYESLYGFGVAATAFAAAELVGGSGFLAAFAAGLTIAALDVELCECFFDYGQATAELGLLFTFVALGSAAIWSGLEAATPAGLAFAAVALFARAPILYTVLAGSGLDRRSRLLTAWFGPRGLSSLLLVLLAVFAGAPGAAELFAVTALVVLLSIVVHGGSQVFLRPPREAVSAAEPEAGRPQSAVAGTALAPGAALAREEAASAAGAADDGERITLDAFDELVRRGAPVVLLDARSDGAWRESPERAAGSRRVPPEGAVEAVGAMNLPPETWLVSYCT